MKKWNESTNQKRKPRLNLVCGLIFAFEVCKAILIFDFDVRVRVHERNERCDTKSALHVIVLIHHIEPHENKMCIYEHKIFSTWNN